MLLPRGDSDRQDPQYIVTTESSVPPVYRLVARPRVTIRIKRSPEVAGPFYATITNAAEATTVHAVAEQQDDFVDVRLPAGIYEVRCAVGIDRSAAPTTMIMVAPPGLTLVVSPEGQIESSPSSRSP